MSNRKYIILIRVFLPFLLLPAISPAGTTSTPETSAEAFSPDLAAAARKVPMRGTLRLEGLELDGIPGASELELERFRVFTPDARIFLDDETLPIPDNRYFKGRIAGEAGSRVLLTLRESGELRGLVLRDGELWVLGGGPGTGIVAPGLVSRRAKPEAELVNRTKLFSCDNNRLPPPRPRFGTFGVRSTECQYPAGGRTELCGPGGDRHRYRVLRPLWRRTGRL